MVKKRLKVTDPHTGVTVTVREGSAQAKVWGETKKPSVGTKKPAGETKQSE